MKVFLLRHSHEHLDFSFDVYASLYLAKVAGMQLMIEEVLPYHHQHGELEKPTKKAPDPLAAAIEQLEWRLDGEKWEIGVVGRSSEYGVYIVESELVGTLPTQTSGSDSMPRTEIYKSGEDISVITTATEERDFLDSFTEALVPVLKNGASPQDKREAVRAGFDIVAKLRGYKSQVQERRILAAGRWPHPSEQPVSTAGSDGDQQA